MLPEKCAKCKVGFAKISCLTCSKKYCELCAKFINGICEICNLIDPFKVPPKGKDFHSGNYIS